MIYFIQSGGDDGPIKIGLTERDLCKRVKELQTASPYPLTLLAAAHGTAVEEIVLHNKFKHLQMEGEWFKPEKELIEYVESIPAISDVSVVPELTEEQIEEKLKTSVLDEILQEVETEYINYAMKKQNWNKSKAAEVLGLTLRQMRYKIDKLKLNF